MKTTTSILVKITAILFALINTVYAASIYSITNGNWTTGTAWSITYGGATCNCTPTKSDNIYIYNNITLDKDLIGGSQGLTAILTVNPGASLNGGSTYSLELRSGSTFTVHGSLTVKDLTFNSGAAVLLQTTGTMTANGIFTNKMSSNNVTLNGAMTVNGTFANNNSGVIAGSGNILINAGPATNGTSATIFGNSTANPCGSFPCILGPGALPIELIAFAASRTDDGVDIEWSTASETNNDYFTIERTADPTTWDQVATVKGAGNSGHLLYYKYTDDDPIMTDCFYRLRQTDYDGNYQIFNPVAVSGVDSFRLHLYPNPASGNRVSINLSEDDMNSAIVKVYDMTGAEVRTTLDTDLDNSVMNIEIDSDAVESARMFYVTVIIGDKMLREKLVID